MSKKPPRSGSFADYQGDLELDMPEGARPSELEKHDRENRPSASTWNPKGDSGGGSANSPIRRRQPEPPPRSGGFPTGLVVVVVILGLLGAGGYYGYSVYKVHSLEHGFIEASAGLKQALLRRNKTVTTQDVRDIVMELVNKANVEIDKSKLKIIIEPLDAANRKRLTTIAQTALSMAAKIPNHRAPRWFVGFNGRFRAKYGLAKKVFLYERYTWFDWAQPDDGAPAPR